jgi:hypothetical protein
MLRKGDAVFLSHVGGTSQCFFACARECIKSLGLIAYAYENCEPQLVQSTLDREIREDFYNSKAVVVVLEPTVSGGTNRIPDFWARRELSHALDRGIPVLVYVVSETPAQAEDATPIPVYGVVTNESDLAAILTHNLQQLMGAIC